MALIGAQSLQAALLVRHRMTNAAKFSGKAIVKLKEMDPLKL